MRAATVTVRGLALLALDALATRFAVLAKPKAGQQDVLDAVPDRAREFRISLHPRPDGPGQRRPDPPAGAITSCNGQLCLVCFHCHLTFQVSRGRRCPRQFFVGGVYAAVPPAAFCLKAAKVFSPPKCFQKSAANWPGVVLMRPSLTAQAVSARTTRIM